MAASAHRIEQITNKVRDNIDRRIKVMSDGLKGDSPRPPFTKRLTEREQLEQYFAMDEKKWKAVIEERGLAEATRYSEAMQKLVRKFFPDAHPETIMLAPQQYAMLEGQPEAPPDMAALVGDSGPPDPSTPGAQSIIQQTLQSVGVDPSQVGV